MSGGEISDEAKRYRLDTDFAFFVVNFHMSRADYESLTQSEKKLIMKAYENKLVSETNLINGAVHNAIVNANRKKGKRPIPFWNKQTSNKYDIEELRFQYKQVEKEDDRSWYQKILRANRR